MTNGIEVARKVFDQEAFGEMVDKEVFLGTDNEEVSSWEHFWRPPFGRGFHFRFPRLPVVFFQTDSLFSIFPSVPFLRRICEG